MPVAKAVFCVPPTTLDNAPGVTVTPAPDDESTPPTNPVLDSIAGPLVSTDDEAIDGTVDRPPTFVDTSLLDETTTGDPVLTSKQPLHPDVNPVALVTVVHSTVRDTGALLESRRNLVESGGSVELIE